MARQTIVIAAGGTGGHVYPGLAVSEWLSEWGIPLLWLGTKRGIESRVVPEAGVPFVSVHVSGVRGKGWASKAIAPFVMVCALLQVLMILIRFRPAAVLGMGGFVSGPTGMAAWLLRLPLIIHEQNAVAGLTNKILARFSVQILEAFPGAFAPSMRALHTGNPVRQAFSNPLSVAVNKDDRSPLRILVLGGSQGARKLNQLVPVVIAQCKAMQLEVHHQSGERCYEETVALYDKANVDACVEPFIKDMAAAYARADLVVCRAGAMTIAEVAMAGVAALLVPYPYAVDDHQSENARYLADAGAAVIIQETDLNEAVLLDHLSTYYKDRLQLREMGNKARTLAKPDAAKRIATLCKELANV